jgi:hypothetical protein
MSISRFSSQKQTPISGSSEFINESLMKMNRFLTRAASAFRDVFTTDRETELFLARTYAEVRRSSRLWGI